MTSARSWRLATGAIVLAAVSGVVACGPAAPLPEPVAPSAQPPPRPAAAPPLVVAPAEEPTIGDAEVQAMLPRVAAARGLPIRRKVITRVLDRAAVLARIRAKVESEIPADVLEQQGEMLIAFGLVPADYDYVAGAFRLIQGRIAGFYDPADGSMVLVDDLDEAEAEQTLAHELVHALQDQSFSIEPMIKFRPGDSDRIAAAHAVIEGDATSGMLDVTVGSAFNITVGELRALLMASSALSSVGATPRVLQSSLNAPYGDGFAFVQELRRKGGWTAVDGALRTPPATTEQLLHVDKFTAREPAVEVPPPSVAALGPGFEAVLDDVVGEQGLRIALEDWTRDAEAARAAAGWGGDRFVVARRPGPEGNAFAVGWRLRMDTTADAGEVARVLERRLGKRCVERPDLGPIAWKASGKDLAVAGGPYTRRAAGTAPRSAGNCELAAKWIEAILRADPR